MPSLISRIRSTHADFVGVMETKNDSFSPGFLRSLMGFTPFSWFFLLGKHTAGGGFFYVATPIDFVVTVSKCRVWF